MRAGYLDLAAAEPERFRVIDSAGSVEETARQLEVVLAELVEAVA